MIDLKQRISANLRLEIKEEYAARCDGLTQDHVDQLKTKFLRKSALIKNSEQDWVRSLYLHIKVLYSILIMDKVYYLDDMQSHHIRIASALSYFIDPMGVIPDHSMGDGFFDDALVINMCINNLPRVQKERIERLLSMAK